jgi:aminodeoxyfutalosine deaminase
VPRLADHPLPALLAAGVPVTLATDNPGLFATDLNSEYALCNEQLGLSRDELVELARAGVDAAFCPPGLRREMTAALKRFEAETGIRPESGWTPPQAL